ncbi:MAG: 30S ribosomal protein S6, partial [Rhodospirillum sp.]|nr:30S ribosomal protein S6 [Rhodospirillum sp.]
MALYECTLIARQDISNAQVDTLGDDVSAMISEGAGSVTKREYWGLRTLHFRIKKNRKGHYLFLNIDAPAPAIHEMERRLRLNEDVIRYMTVKVEELEEAPSAMVQKNDRRERGP